MGNKAGKPGGALKDKDVKRLATAVGVLTEDEIRALYHLFACLKAAGGEGDSTASRGGGGGGGGDDSSLSLT